MNPIRKLAIAMLFLFIIAACPVAQSLIPAYGEATAQLQAEKAFTGKNTNLTIRILTLNTSTLFSYSGQECIRLLEGLAPDVALLEEWSVENADYRAFVDSAFGTGFSFVRDPSGSGVGSLANGIVSRWPFLSEGSWQDVEVSGRWFTWAVIDIPGDINLQVVAVHLKAGSSSTDRNRREIEANNLKTLVQSEFNNNQYILVGGDLNTYSLSEPCLGVFSTFLAYNDQVPVDRNGNSNTNKNRSERYDWLMPNQALEQKHSTLVLGGQSYPEGIVFDSHVFTPLSAVPPIQYDDTHNGNMDHDPVMKTFVISFGPPPPPTPTPTPALEGILSSNSVPTGGSVTFEAVVKPLFQQFDAYGGIMSSSSAFLYSFNIKNPYLLQTGLKPVVSRAILFEPVRKTLYINPMIPPGHEGRYTFIIGLVPSGDEPAVSNAIPGYLWEGTFEVTN
jgi:endonuclease/exonuclease/phosphatase (EEP) superfamily protein YafD